jgi:hypothetical protein
MDEVKAEKTGFKTATRTNIELQAQQAAARRRSTSRPKAVRSPDRL